jgi:hypothetical protein
MLGVPNNITTAKLDAVDIVDILPESAFNDEMLISDSPIAAADKDATNLAAANRCPNYKLREVVSWLAPLFLLMLSVLCASSENTHRYAPEVRHAASC